MIVAFLCEIDIHSFVGTNCNSHTPPRKSSRVVIVIWHTIAPS